MYTTTDIYREMLELGMIDKEEYAELICEYRNHVNALMKMDAAARNAKETIENMKKHEERKKEENPRLERIYDLYMNAHISEEQFKKMIEAEEEKAMKDFDEILTSAEYVGYMRTSLRK